MNALQRCEQHDGEVRHVFDERPAIVDARVVEDELGPDLIGRDLRGSGRRLGVERRGKSGGSVRNDGDGESESCSNPQG